MFCRRAMQRKPSSTTSFSDTGTIRALRFRLTLPLGPGNKSCCRICVKPSLVYAVVIGVFLTLIKSMFAEYLRYVFPSMIVQILHFCGFLFEFEHSVLRFHSFRVFLLVPAAVSTLGLTFSSLLIHVSRCWVFYS